MLANWEKAFTLSLHFVVVTEAQSLEGLRLRNIPVVLNCRKQREDMAIESIVHFILIAELIKRLLLS